MKAIAFGLLAAAGVLYLVAAGLRDRHPAWGYVAAFAEAAMIGAIADWFAVVALFRHPLNIRIPHTAIIPANKSRIGENLATFICANFLSTPQLLEKIGRFGAGARLARWLADRRHAAQLAGHAGATFGYALGTLHDERVQHFLRMTLVGHLAKIDAAGLASQMLAALTADGRHHAVLNAVLRKLAVVLDDEGLQTRVAELIADEVKYLRYVGLDAAAGRYATTKLVAGVIRLIDEMAADAEHPLRLKFDALTASFIVRLNDDPELRAKVASLQHELLASPALSDYLNGLWSDVLDWLRADLERSAGSIVRARAFAAIRLVGQRLQTDLPMQRWIDEQLIAIAPRWIERYREDIRRYIAGRVSEWNADEMTRELELNIGRDLQFIRINGTLVGGLVGLGIYALTQWVRAL